MHVIFVLETGHFVCITLTGFQTKKIPFFMSETRRFEDADRVLEPCQPGLNPPLIILLSVYKVLYGTYRPTIWRIIIN